MTRELSHEARSVIRDAIAEEQGPGSAHRARLRRKVLARAAAGGVVTLLGESVAKASAYSLLAVVSSGVGVGFGVGLVLAGAAQLAFKPRAQPSPSERALETAIARPLQARSTLEPSPPVPGAAAEQAPSVEPPGASESNRGSSQPGAAAASSKRNATEVTPSNGSGAVPGSPLRAELDLMARVQEALRDARGARALELIAQYDAHHPSGMLETERLAAEVFAACQTGDSARARRAAARFLARDSASPLSARVKHACASQ